MKTSNRRMKCYKFIFFSTIAIWWIYPMGNFRSLEVQERTTPNRSMGHGRKVSAVCIRADAPSGT